ncbi:hypothetical protein Ccrd_025488 [Cynara cardunculus var. scolymus]|uniref:Uncharacterized protein n=1 Tax=Cynara cardunculus var. scolymus TaxID=59895 RepID=A0A103WY17_CYNCS|nr:hypothetical protein Ccrd_025488 [Cynara cardunculus var. scolymus]
MSSYEVFNYDNGKLKGWGVLVRSYYLTEWGVTSCKIAYALEKTNYQEQQYFSEAGHEVLCFWFQFTSFHREVWKYSYKAEHSKRKGAWDNLVSLHREWTQELKEKLMPMRERVWLDVMAIKGQGVAEKNNDVGAKPRIRCWIEKKGDDGLSLWEERSGGNSRLPSSSRQQWWFLLSVERDWAWRWRSVKHSHTHIEVDGSLPKEDVFAKIDSALANLIEQKNTTMLAT